MELELQYFPEQNTTGICRCVVAYVDNLSVVGDACTEMLLSPLCLTAPEVLVWYVFDFHDAQIVFHGGTVVREISDLVTHVVIDADDTSRLPLLQSAARRRTRMCHVVLSDWVTASIEIGQRKDEAHYRI
jgi:hypothetical protein